MIRFRIGSGEAIWSYCQSQPAGSPCVIGYTLRKTFRGVQDAKPHGRRLLSASALTAWLQGRAEFRLSQITIVDCLLMIVTFYVVGPLTLLRCGWHQ